MPGNYINPIYGNSSGGLNTGAYAPTNWQTFFSTQQNISERDMINRMLQDHPRVSMVMDVLANSIGGGGQAGQLWKANDPMAGMLKMAAMGMADKGMLGGGSPSNFIYAMQNTMGLSGMSMQNGMTGVYDQVRGRGFLTNEMTGLMANNVQKEFFNKGGLNNLARTHGLDMDQMSEVLGGLTADGAFAGLRMGKVKTYNTAKELAEEERAAYSTGDTELAGKIRQIKVGDRRAVLNDESAKKVKDMMSDTAELIAQMTNIYGDRGARELMNISKKLTGFSFGSKAEIRAMKAANEAVNEHAQRYNNGDTAAVTQMIDQNANAYGQFFASEPLSRGAARDSTLRAGALVNGQQGDARWLQEHAGINVPVKSYGQITEALMSDRAQLEKYNSIKKIRSMYAMMSGAEGGIHDVEANGFLNKMSKATGAGDLYAVQVAMQTAINKFMPGYNVDNMNDMQHDSAAATLSPDAVGRYNTAVGKTQQSLARGRMDVLMRGQFAGNGIDGGQMLNFLKMTPGKDRAAIAEALSEGPNGNEYKLLSMMGDADAQKLMGGNFGNRTKLSETYKSMLKNNRADMELVSSDYDTDQDNARDTANDFNKAKYGYDPKLQMGLSEELVRGLKNEKFLSRNSLHQYTANKDLALSPDKRTLSTMTYDTNEMKVLGIGDEDATRLFKQLGEGGADLSEYGGDVNKFTSDITAKKGLQKLRKLMKDGHLSYATTGKKNDDNTQTDTLTTMTAEQYGKERESAGNEYDLSWMVGERHEDESIEDYRKRLEERRPELDKLKDSVKGFKGDQDAEWRRKFVEGEGPRTGTVGTRLVEGVSNTEAYAKGWLSPDKYATMNEENRKMPFIALGLKANSEAAKMYDKLTNIHPADGPGMLSDNSNYTTYATDALNIANKINNKNAEGKITWETGDADKAYIYDQRNIDKETERLNTVLDKGSNENVTKELGDIRGMDKYAIAALVKKKATEKATTQGNLMLEQRNKTINTMAYSPEGLSLLKQSYEFNKDAGRDAMAKALETLIKTIQEERDASKKQQQEQMAKDVAKKEAGAAGDISANNIFVTAITDSLGRNLLHQ